MHFASHHRWSTIRTAYAEVYRDRGDYFEPITARAFTGPLRNLRARHWSRRMVRELDFRATDRFGIRAHVRRLDQAAEAMAAGAIVVGGTLLVSFATLL